MSDQRSPPSSTGASPASRILAAGLVSGLGIWCSLGELERVSSGVRTLRVAVLPSPWVALACGLLATAGLFGLGRFVSRMTRERESSGAARGADLYLPAFAAGVLALPYLPHLADWFPALTVLAGRFKWLVWTVLIVLLGRATILRIDRPMRFGRRPWVCGALVFVAGLALYGSVAARLIDSPMFPGGDEPHYLVIAQSLWRDGDLRIEDNHRRGDTFEYFKLPLKPHYLRRGTDGQIYSIHPIGLAVALAPIYALGGYHAVVAAMIAVAALAGLVAWRLARRWTSPSSATVGWLACAAGAPYVFNSFTVYPEIPAALATILAFDLATRLDGATRPARCAFGCGVALATLPWLSSKYAAMAAAIGAVATARLLFAPVSNGVTRGARVRALSLLAATPLVSLALWFAFFAAIWGTPSPSAPYGSQRAMGVEYLAAGAPGLFFDQEYGIVAMGPALVLAFGGLGWMLASRGKARRVAVEIVIVAGALLLPVAAFHQWWGGTAAVGRPLVAALLLLTVPAAWVYEQAREREALRSACWLLIAGGLAIVVTVAWAQQGLLLVAERDGTSRLLTWWSPSWPLVAVAPSFVAQPPGLAAAEAALWVAALAAGFALLARVSRVEDRSRAALVAFGAAALSLTVVTAAVPWIPGRSELHARDLSERAESTLLHDFDARRRPVGIVYNPFRFVSPTQVASMVQFSAGPEPRDERTPVPLLYRARWSLPAGQYRLELSLPDGTRRMTGQLGLQLGRLGRPIETWDIDVVGRWSTTFDLPVDVRFVGLRASDELTALRPRVGLRALRVTNASERAGAGEVLELRRIGATIIFFHDEGSYPESTGAWLKADATTRLSMAGPPGAAVMRLRAGAAATTLDLRIDGRRETVALARGQGRDIPLPPTDRARRVEITTRGGFVPAEVSPGSTDARRLSCWLEIAAS